MTQINNISQQRLSRSQMFPDRQKTDKENALKPNYKCFCCSDTGLIQPNLVKQIIPDYDFKRDRMPVCSRCDARDRFVQGSQIYPSLDFRISRSTCEVFHQQMKKVWDEEPSPEAKAKVKEVLEYLSNHFGK